MEPDEIKTIEDLCQYIEQYKDDIYIRALLNGEWGSYSLTELPASQAITYSLRFIAERRIPVRVIR